MLVPILDCIVEYRADQRIKARLSIETGNQGGNRGFGNLGEAFHVLNMEINSPPGKRQSAAASRQPVRSAEAEKGQDRENDDDQSDDIDDVVHGVPSWLGSINRQTRDLEQTFRLNPPASDL